MTSPHPDSYAVDPTTPTFGPYTFNHVPKLGPHRDGDQRASLLPKRGGIPGLEYAQIPVLLKKQAENDGWLSIHGAATYTIFGPKGTVDCELLARGAIIRGIDAESGSRVCHIDQSVWEVTGLDPKTGWPPVPEPPKPAKAEKPKPVSQPTSKE